MQAFKDFSYSLVKTVAGVYIVDMTPLKSTLSTVLPNNKLGTHAGAGVSYTLVKNAIDHLTVSSCCLSRGEWLCVADDISFFTTLSYAADASNVDMMAYNVVSKSGSSPEMSKRIVEGAVISAGTILADVLDAQTGDNVIFDAIRKPVSTTLGLIKA